jgi:cysteine desulfurase/selenocysteine lyase
MISDVTFERTLFQHPPTKFEAGTGNIADAVGLATALDYLNRLGRPAIERYEHELIRYAVTEICRVPGLRLVGTAPEKVSVLTFELDGCRPADVASALDREGIEVRSGHHCAQPILRRYGLETAVRASLAMYNTYAEVDLLVATLHRLAAATGNRR